MGDWTGILVSDGSRVYQYWEGLRQSCLAHLIRAAQGLAEKVEAGCIGQQFFGHLGGYTYAASAKAPRCSCLTWAGALYPCRPINQVSLY